MEFSKEEAEELLSTGKINRSVSMKTTTININDSMTWSLKKN